MLKGEKSRRTTRYLFAVYCIVMLMLLFVRDQYDVSRPYLDLIRENHNLIPFFTIRGQLRCLFSARRSLIRYAVINLGGNTLLFVPLGFFLPLCFEKLRSILKTFGTVAAIITAVELLQLFTLRGYADIDDLILNVSGAAVGYGFYKLLCKIIEK